MGISSHCASHGSWAGTDCAALEASRGDGRGAWEVPLMISLSEHF